ADLETVVRLEEIRLSYNSDPREGAWDVRPEGLAAYEREFHALGIDLDGLPVEEASRRIGARPIRDQLIAALDDWTVLGRCPGFEKSGKPKGWWRRPLTVARAADTDRFRNRVRLAVEGDDRPAMLELARSPEAVHGWASTLVLLQYAIGKRELRIELLEKAQR